MQVRAGIHSLFFCWGIFLCALLFGITNAVPASARATHNAIGSNDRYAALVVDADTGTVLHQENATKLRYPASLTKMMTLYLTFEAIDNGHLTMDQVLPVSAYAASRPRMNMNLHRGDRITVRDAILSLIVRSANDTAVVLAEAISGNEIAFARRMTARAANLGMKDTTFRNASGLPDNSQKTTAFDLARLAIALRRDFPQYYPLFSRTSFTYRGHVWEGHNHLTSFYPGADGLKTGFVNASGFNLVTSAKRGNTKLVGVVMGGDTARLRDRRMVTLLDFYFSKISGGVVNAAYAESPPATTRSAAGHHHHIHKAHAGARRRAHMQQAALHRKKSHHLPTEARNMRPEQHAAL